MKFLKFHLQDVVVYTRSVGGHPVNPKNVNLIINVPVPENKLNQNIIENEGIDLAFTKFRYTYKFRIGIYEGNIKYILTLNTPFNLQRNNFEQKSRNWRGNG